jgi:transcriptional regulator with XRE-family HTH domain
MPKDPKNKANSLRQLRELLASPEGRKRISQIDLARMCRISANTIKKIEFGIRPLNPSILTKIRIGTHGAVWDPEQNRWTRFDGKPFTYEDYSERRKRVQNPSAIDQAIKSVMVDLIQRRIEWLFNNVPATSWEGLRSRLTIFLDECQREYRITANDALFYRFAPLDSASESAAAEPVKAEQQKRRRSPKGAAGNKKRKRKYGL